MSARSNGDYSISIYDFIFNAHQFERETKNENEIANPQLGNCCIAVQCVHGAKICKSYFEHAKRILCVRVRGIARSTHTDTPSVRMQLQIQFGICDGTAQQ